MAQRARDSLGGTGVIPQVGSSRLLVQLSDLLAQLVRLHDREDIFHRGSQGRDLFRKFNGHTPRVTDSAPNQGREESIGVRRYADEAHIRAIDAGAPTPKRSGHRAAWSIR